MSGDLYLQNHTDDSRMPQSQLVYIILFACLTKLMINAAAVLALTEPAQTGIGGDMFALFYDADAKKVRALNGSGWSVAGASLESVRRELGLKDGENDSIPVTSVHAVTRPGAAGGWVDVVEKFGSGTMTLERILAPAIKLAEEGFPVSAVSSSFVGFF